MENQKNIDKIIFYFDNACPKVHKGMNGDLVNKVRFLLKRLNPRRMWEEKGIVNEKLQIGVYPDFVIILDDKIIACEVEKQSLLNKFALYDGIKIFDEIWFFTDIPIEKKHLHYKFENELKIPQKFFGINEQGEIINIK